MSKTKQEKIDQLKKLSAMAIESSKQLNSQIRLVGDVLAETLRDAPEEHKREVEELQALMTKSINLAKQGKTEKVNDIIKKYRYGRKNNK